MYRKNTSRSTPYLAAKAKGDNSMALKRRGEEDAYEPAPQDLGDTAKAKLLKSQYPAMQSHILRLQHLNRGAISLPGQSCMAPLSNYHVLGKRETSAEWPW